MKIEGSGLALPVRPRNGAVGDQLETAFLSEMLALAMPDGGAGAFGGGAGESQFSSFLVEQHAALWAARLDLGLADRIGAARG